MNAEVTDRSKAIREEVRHLFGISWDRFIEWTIIVWLSAWIWTAWTVSEAVVFPASGPIEWIADVIGAFGGTAPDWLLGIPEWLTDPKRAMLLPIAVMVAAVVATFALRSYALTGLRVLALVAAVVAVEIEGSMWPLAWIVLVAAVPCVIAIVIGFLPDRHDALGDESRWESFYYPAGAVERFALRVVGLFLVPVVVPIFLIPALVVNYRIDREYRPAEELARRAAASLSTSRGGAEESDGLAAVGAVVAAITAGSSSRTSAVVASSFNYQLRERERERRAKARWA